MHSKTRKTKITRFLNLAKQLALTSDVYRYKHGACIVKKGHIIAQGNNMYKSHPLQRQYNEFRHDIDTDAPHYMHAEINAITKSMKNYDLSDAELYVYRVSAKGTPAMSRPCAACMNAIRDIGIKTVYYTTDGGFAQEEIDIGTMEFSEPVPREKKQRFKTQT